VVRRFLLLWLLAGLGIGAASAAEDAGLLRAYARAPRVSAAALAETGGGTATTATTDTTAATDETFSVTIVCDPKSYLYLNGTVIDYKDEIMGSGFVFNNPNSTSTCGCGSSFSA
jgi:Fe-S cluster assembly iron-binding protein IscA